MDSLDLDETQADIQLERKHSVDRSMIKGGTVETERDTLGDLIREFEIGIPSSDKDSDPEVYDRHLNEYWLYYKDTWNYILLPLLL